LYDGLTTARRASLHRKVAEAIEAAHAGRLDDQLPALAHHWARASTTSGDTARAADYARRAGDRALAQLAHDEAAAYYRSALELLDAAEGRADDPERLRLLIALGRPNAAPGTPTTGTRC
jgi:predicted ATPase